VVKRKVSPLWITVSVVVVLVGLGALWHVRFSQSSSVRPEQAYRIQQKELEGLAKSAPRNPTPGKYAVPPDFPRASAAGR